MSERQSSSELVFTLAVEASSGHRAYIYHLAASERLPTEGGRIHHQPPQFQNKIILMCRMVGDENKRLRSETGLN